MFWTQNHTATGHGRPMAAHSPINTAAQLAVDKVKRSVDQALLKDKRNYERDAITQYVRDASFRMSWNLSIKPPDTKLNKKNERSNYELPKLKACGTEMPSAAKPRKGILDQLDVAGRLNTSQSIDSSLPPRGTKLPPIGNTLKSVKNKCNKRKRKRKDDGIIANFGENCNQFEQKKHPIRSYGTAHGQLQHCPTADTTEDPLSVVLCGRSPFDFNHYGEDTLHEFMVSKHGRFKSK